MQNQKKKILCKECSHFSKAQILGVPLGICKNPEIVKLFDPGRVIDCAGKSPAWCPLCYENGIKVTDDYEGEGDDSWT